MLGKTNRLLAEKDFSKLFSKGKPFNARGIGMKMVPNRSGHPRIGFVVSTKVAKNAVDRNRIKRRLREIVRPLLPGMSSAGMDVAFMARGEALKMSFEELRASVAALLEKAGLIKK